jgi:hypothetical protein
MAAGITLSYAISAGQDGGCFCGGCGGLLAASDCCRLLCSASPRFRTKFFTHANSVCFAEFLAVSSRFAHAGFCSKPQRDSYRNPQISDKNHSQSYPDPNSDSHSDTNAIVARPEYHADAYANSKARDCVDGRSRGCPAKVF